MKVKEVLPKMLLNFLIAAKLGLEYAQSAEFARKENSSIRY